MAKLFFRYAAMNAGKSSSLLQVAHNYGENGMSVELFTAEIDDRYGKGRITSRMGPSRDARTFDTEFDFSAHLAQHRPHAVLVDEAQFLTQLQVVQLHKAAHLSGIPVICYGLRTDFRGDPFPGAIHLLALADSIEEIRTICQCARKATMNVRVDRDGKRVTSGERIVIGGNETYRQVCGGCFYTM